MPEVEVEYVIELGVELELVLELVLMLDLELEVEFEVVQVYKQAEKQVEVDIEGMDVGAGAEAEAGFDIVVVASGVGESMDEAGVVAGMVPAEDIRLSLRSLASLPSLVCPNWRVQEEGVEPS